MLMLIVYLFNIRPKLHHQKWQKLRVILPVSVSTEDKHARIIFGMQFERW